jgi:exosome complex component RRP40
MAASSSVVRLPGEVVLHAPSGATLVLGRGLRQRAVGPGRADDDGAATVEATLGGVLRQDTITLPDSGERAPVYEMLAEGAKRYVPARGDAVVGVVIRVSPQSYTVHLGGAHPATLEALAFDGASKVNRPKLVVGDLVYAHVTAADVDVEPELSCCAVGDMPRKDWSTGEAVFGPLHASGRSVVVPLAHAAALVANTCPALLIAGGRVGFEAAIGVNGRVWLRVAQGVPRKALVALSRVVHEAADCRNAEEVQALVDKFFPPPTAA